MSTYKYTDKDGDDLEVFTNAFKTVTVSVLQDGEWCGAVVPNEDAPAVALAILEAAGIKAFALRADGNIKDHASRAVSCLHAWQVERAAKEIFRESP